MGTKKKNIYIYRYKLKLENKLVHVKKTYKLKIEVYDTKFSHEYKFIKCNVSNTKQIYLMVNLFFIIKNKYADM